MRYRRSIVKGGTFFFTLVTHERRPIFEQPLNAVTWGRAVSEVQRRHPFTVEAEVILPDHVHAIWSLPAGEADYATRIRLVKSAFSRACSVSGLLPVAKNTSRIGRGERHIWQRRYWEHAIRDERDYQAHVDYIHINPVKHGLVARPADWLHSTFSTWVARGAYDPWWGSSEVPYLPDGVGHE